MPLQHLQHFLIQTEGLEKTKDWYVDVLGMRVGPHPDFKFPVYWLYLGDADVLHLTTGGKNVSENRMKYLGQQSTAASGSGVIDHVAFRATGLLDLIEHLQRKGIDFKERRVNDQGLYQLFLLDPNGVKVELNFEAAEAAGREPELMASALPRREGVIRPRDLRACEEDLEVERELSIGRSVPPPPLAGEGTLCDKRQC
jgi:catechol 2,3-dioxygenase-like lactoylglutathione lyase family enzyme